MQETPLEFSNHGNALRLIKGDRRVVSVADSEALSVEAIVRYSADWLGEAEYLQQSPHTITGKKDVIAKLLWWMERFNHTACGTRELRHFLAYVGNGHTQPGGRWGRENLTKAATSRTVQYYFNYLRGFSRWLVSEGILQIDITAGLAAPKNTQEQIQPFSIDQIKALLQAARHLTNPKRDEAILLFGLDTGVRASELCDVTLDNMDLHGSYGQVTVLGKGRKKRTLPFSRKAARSIWQYLREMPRMEKSPLFLSDRGTSAGAPLTRWGLLQLYERLGEAANIQSVRCSPHTMRHTFAINYLRNGGKVFTLQHLLGHTDLKMTMKYVAISQADKEQEHRQFSPADRIKD